MTRILLVEDDQAMYESLKSFLEKYGHQVFGVGDFRDVVEEFTRISPHLVLLDINLPYSDGFQLIRAMRRISSVPVIVVSARGGEMEQVLGMELGADDYVVKPFSAEVLLAKIHAVLRRTGGELAHGEQTPPASDALQLDDGRLAARYRERNVDLTKNEFRLLKLLLEARGRIVRREELFEALWDEVSFVDENTLSVNVTRVKAKLEELGLTGVIRTKRGVGYSLDPSQPGERP